MLDGDIFLEGISLRDDSYDGLGSKRDRRVLQDQQQHQPIVNQQQPHMSLLTPSSLGSSTDKENVVNIFHRDAVVEGEGEDREDDENGENDDEGREREDKMNDWDREDRKGDEPERLLSGGLGKLTDKIEGANSFTMDIGYGLGKNNFSSPFTSAHSSSSSSVSVSISLCLFKCLLALPVKPFSSSCQ